MKGKAIRIDWDDLETAFSNRNEELVYYLDTVTGRVHLEGEGETDDDEDELTPAPPVRGADKTRLYVDPPGGEALLGWMKEFLQKANDIDGDVAKQLEEALNEDNPLAAVADALRDNAEARDRWFLYRSDRVHELIESWLAEHDIQPTDTPPWKS